MSHFPQPPSEDPPMTHGQHPFRAAAANLYRRHIEPDVYSIGSLVGGTVGIIVSPTVEQFNHTAGVGTAMISIGALTLGVANLIIGKHHIR